MIKINKNIFKIFPILNVLFLLLNVFLFFINTYNFNSSFEKIFKYSDNFNINLMQKTFKQISKYLENKYNTINQFSFNNIFLFKKVIKLKRTGLFNKTHHLIWLKKRLNNEFILKFDDENPDYLIFNVFSNEDMNPKYDNAIKIAIYTENFMPDINYADYIFGHYHINYLDRYYKYSIFLWRNFNPIDEIRKKVIQSPTRKKFCAAVISNCVSGFRLKFINELNNYKKIDMGGRCKNNVGGNVRNKIEFLKSYKFSIAMENSIGDGYISEKLTHSFLAGTIPIYYGDYLIDEYINPKTYIFIKGVNDIEKKIEYIKKIDNDDKLYRSIMKEKPIIDDDFTHKIDNIDIKLFLKNIFMQDKKKAYRRDNNFYDFRCKKK